VHHHPSALANLLGQRHVGEYGFKAPEAVRASSDINPNHFTLTTPGPTNERASPGMLLRKMDKAEPGEIYTEQGHSTVQPQQALQGSPHGSGLLASHQLICQRSEGRERADGMVPTAPFGVTHNGSRKSTHVPIYLSRCQIEDEFRERAIRHVVSRPILQWPVVGRWRHRVHPGEGWYQKR
jgi:hypothetical protein